MKIYIKSIIGHTAVIEAESSDSIRDIKNKISAESLCPPDQIKLTYSGRLLDDAQTLFNYNIANQSTLHLICLIKNTTEDESKRQENDEIISDMDIYFVPYFKREIYKIDLNTFHVSLIFNPSNISIGYGPQLCPISRTKIFFQGGIVNSAFLSATFIIDLSIGSFTTKANGPVNAAGTSVIYGNFIYTFGGAFKGIYEPSPLSQKYDIRKDEWIPLTPLPIPSYNNTGIYIENKVAIVGQHLSNIYYYDPKINSYNTNIALNGQYKLITMHERVIYVILVNAIKIFEHGE